MTTVSTNRASFSSSSGALMAVPYALTQGDVRNFDLTTSPQDTTAITIDDPPYLTSQLNSSEWLKRYGLKAQQLTFDQILQQIGYKRLESFVPSIGKTVGAKYTGDQYHEVQHDNGDHYILTCRPEKLREYKNHLTRLLTLLRKRLAFLTSGSRRLFGMIAEPSVCFVCDCKTNDHRRLNQFQTAVISLLKEQVSKIKRFNIIWVSNDKEQYEERPVDVTAASIDQAIDWIGARQSARNPISISATCEALLKAFTNPVHSIYLITEGESSDSAREILRDNIVKTRLTLNLPIPVHVVSLFCHNNDTETFLRSIAQTTNGSFISYKLHHERTDLRPTPNASEPTGIRFQNNTLNYGTNTTASKPEQPVDLSLMYKEINQCHVVIDRLDRILGFVQDENDKALQKFDARKSLDTAGSSSKTGNGTTAGNNPRRALVVPSSTLFTADETEMSSLEWLKNYGIEAQKLDVTSALQSAAFRHCDGVVTVLKAPEDAAGKFDKTPANASSKLINAKYCDQFAHMAWPDGTIRHVFVSTDMHREYERRMHALLEKMRARMAWLKKGSRDLFGTIVEKNIYILVDTSVSMRNHLDFVKDKLRLLIQDQLFSKERLNIVAFNTVVNPWRDRLTKINDPSTTSQLQTWIDELYAEGSTNTLAALRFALADSVTEAIYLLTDGRPDQTERHILSQVQYRDKVPIHTIAFNCQDQLANQFLIDLSRQTGGRFHAYNYGPNADGPTEIPESEDLVHLKQELARGERELKRIGDLCDECTGRAWSMNALAGKYKNLRPTESSASLPVRSHSSLDTTARPQTTPPQRLDRKKSASALSMRKHKVKPATKVLERTNRITLDPSQWLLPETEQYLLRNDKQPRPLPVVQLEEQPGDDVADSAGERIPTPKGEVKAYLRKHGLVARGLTIFDVLHPTTMTVRNPAHEQVIDRETMAKVWQDLLPLAHGRYAGKFRLMSYRATNLEKYELDLKDLIEAHYKFASRFIWDQLGDDDRKRIGPSIYWSSLPQDDQEKLAKEITADEYVNQTALEVYAWNKESDERKKSLLQKPPVYHAKTQVMLKNALKDAANESALQGVALIDAEIERAIKFLQISTDLRQHQRQIGAESKPVSESLPTVKTTSPVKSAPSGRGQSSQRVLCRYEPDGYFYVGSLHTLPDRTKMVHFDMDVEQEAIGNVYMPFNPAFLPNLFLNDAVLVRQMRNNEEFWAPGLVMGLPRGFVLPANVYMIQVYDPKLREVYAHRKDLIRITIALYQRSVLYLEQLYSDARTYPPYYGGRIPDRPSPDNHGDFEKILKKQLDRLSSKIERSNEEHQERYEKLRRTLVDHGGAIRILQETPKKQPRKKSPERKTKDEKKPTPPPSPKPNVPKPETPPIPPPTPEPARLSAGTKVYAVWGHDDALVYKSIVKEYDGMGNYLIERAALPGIVDSVSRRDIFLLSERMRLKDMREESCAFIKYPDEKQRCFCSAEESKRACTCPKAILTLDRFCPVAIRKHEGPTTQICLYDCWDISVNNDQDVIPITNDQFKEYIDARFKYEQSLEDQVTVGLNSQSNTFKLGTIKKRVKDGHRYVIEWEDKTTSEQTDANLFTAVFTRLNQHVDGNHVLARDESDHAFKPAKVVSVLPKQTLLVEFAPSTKKRNTSARRVEVPATTTFVISEENYNRISELY